MLGRDGFLRDPSQGAVDDLAAAGKELFDGFSLLHIIISLFLSFFYFQKNLLAENFGFSLYCYLSSP